MIAKCIAVLAIVAQINAYCVNQVVPSCGSAISGSQVVLGSSGIAGVSGLSTGAGVAGVSTGAGAAVKNIVANGKYPVAMTNCGPNPDSRVPVTTSAVSAPVQEKPTVRLPCNIPAPRCVSHTCTCYKTVLKPRVHQQIITVPSVQRYIQTTHRPVVENIQYEAIPVNCCGDNVVSGVVGASGVVEATGVPAFGVGQTIAVPQVQAVQPVAVQQVQAVQPVAVGSFGSCAC